MLLECSWLQRLNKFLVSSIIHARTDLISIATVLLFSSHIVFIMVIQHLSSSSHSADGPTHVLCSTVIHLFSL